MGKRKYEDGGGNKTSKKKTKTQSETECPQEESEMGTVTEEKKNSSNSKSKVFDVKHFRKELATKSGNTVALTQFLQVCLNPDSEVDYMAEYLKAGGNSHEILRQVNQDNKKNLTLATPAFHLFHLIILKVQSGLPDMISITEEACRYFLNHFTSTVEIMISENSGPRHRKIILKLFTSMVTLNPDLGVEVLNQAPLTPKHLQYILEKPNYKEKDNVRTAFVHFMTSFLVEGHLPLIKALLDKQGLLPLVIPGLVQDEADAVLMFLNILKKNVIENILISKSIKLKTFSHNVLHLLFKLYYWRGPPESSHEVINEFRPEIHSLLSEIITILFTSNKLGLYFVDTTLGTTDANKNQNLYKALLTLKRPWENKSQSDIILNIIYQCPDLHRAVIHLIEQSFEPQQTPIWERTVDFFVNLLDKLRPEVMLPRTLKLTPSQLANFVRFNTLPVPLLKHIQNTVGKSEHTMSLYCIKMLVKMLNSLKSFMWLIKMDSSQNHIVDLKNKLDLFLPKHLPGPGSIVSLINQIINDKDTNNSTPKEYQLPKISKSDSLILLIDLLLLYKELQPAYFETLESSLHMKEILNFAMALNEERTSILKFKVVSLWLTVDNSAVSLKNPLFKDLFQIMLEVYSSEETNTWVEAKEIIFSFFKSTSIFEDDNEIYLMLYSIRKNKPNMSILGDIVEYVLDNYKSLAEYTRTQLLNLEISDENSKTNLDKLLDGLMKSANTDDMAFLETKVPSPFIVGCLKYIQVKDSKEIRKSLKPFLCSYIANLLHFNFNPELIQVLLGDFKIDVRNYIESWISNPISLTETMIGKDLTLLKISDAVVNMSNAELKNIFTFIDESTDDQCNFTISNTPLKFKDVEIDSTDFLIWARYLIFSSVQLSNLGQLRHEQQKVISELFFFIMEATKHLHKTDISRNIILDMFKNPQVLKIYEPIDLNKDQSNILATTFIIEVVNKCQDVIKYLDKNDNVLKPFQQKNYNEIVKALAKSKKRKNCNSGLTIELLQVIGMSVEDDNKIFKLLFELDLNSFVKEDKEPSLFLEILHVLVSKYSKSVKNLVVDVLLKTVDIYSKLLADKTMICNLSSFESTLNEYFEDKPEHAKYVSEEMFKQFFYAQNIRKTTSILASTILRLNVKLANIFIKQLTRNEILSQRELTLPLGKSLLSHNQFLNSNIDLLINIFKEYKNNILKLCEKPHKAGQIYFSCWELIRKVIFECMEVEECFKFFSKTYKFETVDNRHLHLIHTMFLKMCNQQDTLKSDHFINYFVSMLNSLQIAIKESKDATTLSAISKNIIEVVEITRQTMNQENSDSFKRVTENSVWQNVCKAILKYSVKVKTDGDDTNVSGPILVQLLSTLIEILYPKDHDDIVTLFDMVTSHSEFLKVMLSYNSPQIKTALIELIYALITKNKSVMKAQQIPVYLSAYHATRSPSDRQILTILNFYEVNDLPVRDYKPYLFGDSAANHYAVRKSKTSSLWAHPTPNQIMNLFDRETILRTLKHFPVLQKLEYNYKVPSHIMGVDGFYPESDSLQTLLRKLNEDGIFEAQKLVDVELTVRKCALRRKYNDLISKIGETDYTAVSHRNSQEAIYDPAFLFPLLSHILAPGSVASCFKLFRTGLLSVPVVALSSHCPKMRAAAYHVLHRFCLLLETETRHKNDKLLLTDFVELLRQSLVSAINMENENMKQLKNPRLPAVNALYLAKALMASTAPSDPLYKPVNNFFIAKQQIDLTVIPDFLSLFHDSDVETAERKLWILEVIGDGTKTMSDVNVVFKTMCIKMIMDYYSSVLCDRKTQDRILSVMISLAAVPRALDILVVGYGFLAWLHGVVRDLTKEDRSLFKKILYLIQNTITSLNINLFHRSLALLRKNNKSVVDIVDVKVDKDLEHDVLIILHDLVNLFDHLEVEDVALFIKTCNLISKRTIKLLSKKQILSIVEECSRFVDDNENVNLLKKAIGTSNSEVLKSKSVVNNIMSKEDLIQSLNVLVSSYMM